MITLAIALLLVSSIIQGLVANSIWLGRGKHISLPVVSKDESVQNSTNVQIGSIKHKRKLHHPGSKLRRQLNRASIAATFAESEGAETYTCPVLIGGQLLALELDTGSPTSWVFSSLLPPDELVGHIDYNPDDSSTYHNLGLPFALYYLDDDAVSGVMGSDTISIGGIPVPGQAFGVSSSLSEALVEKAPDGILGLGFGIADPNGLPSFFENVQESLSSPVIAVYLPWADDGVYDIGLIDSSKYTGTIIYTPIDSSHGKWEFKSPSYMVGSTTYTAPGITAVADSGADMIYMQAYQVEKYYAAVPGASFSNVEGGYIFPCESVLPSLSVEIDPNGNFATIPGTVLNYGLPDNNQCFGGLQILYTSTRNIYGHPFFAAYYAIYDISVPQFGFATIA